MYELLVKLDGVADPILVARLTSSEKCSAMAASLIDQVREVQCNYVPNFFERIWEVIVTTPWF